jgi:hypothetical protein
MERTIMQSASFPWNADIGRRKARMDMARSDTCGQRYVFDYRQLALPVHGAKAAYYLRLLSKAYMSAEQIQLDILN